MNKLPESKLEIELVSALAWMWIQFCPDNWHQFLGAAEDAEEILKEYGLLIDRPNQNPEFNHKLLEKLENILAPNQDLETHLKLIKESGEANT